MTSPLFLSYSWADEAEADRLDALLRFRGIPIWRDRRAMRWGEYHEDQVRQAITEICSGFAIYLTPEALNQQGSRFITDVELPQMDNRRRIDSNFFSGAIFSGYRPTDGSEAVRRICGLTIGSTFGSPIMREHELDPQLRDAANAILRRYVSSLSSDSVRVFFDTRQEIPWQEASDIHLAWHPPLEHDLGSVDTGVWDGDLVPALIDLNAALRSERASTRLVVEGQPHLSAALAFGHTFRAPGPWELELVGYNGSRWYSGPRQPDDCGWAFEKHAGQTGAGHDALVVCIHATHQIETAVRAARRVLPSPRATLDLCPPGGSSHTSIDPESANGLAAAMAAAIAAARAEYGAAETHLYMACPWPFAALLGYHLASAGPVISFDANLARDNYHRACRLA